MEPLWLNNLDALESEPEQDFEYKLLQGHSRTDGSWKTSDQLRVEYVELTDGLIHAMTEGIQVEDPDTHELSKRRPDFVVWLDKSARPVSWLTKELWPLLAKDKSGNIPQMPTFRYVNIDREQWVNIIDPSGVGITRVDRLDDSIIRGLRSIFVEPKYKQAGLDESIDEAPSELDGKTILIIDEVRSSGHTLEYAQNFFKRAFPASKIAAQYWMGGQTMRQGAVGNADLPVWYKDDTMFGRGVGSRDERLAQRSRSLTQRLGGMFLGNRLEGQDEQSLQLRKELHQLALAATLGHMLVRPSISRDIEDYDERATRINQIDMEEFSRRLNELREQT